MTIQDLDLAEVGAKGERAKLRCTVFQLDGRKAS
jgi:hypothetical protein